MRDDIYTEVIVNGKKEKRIDLLKVTGTGYERGWFTNCYCRYRIFVGARSTKKSYNIIGAEPIFKILSDERRNIMMLRQNDSDNRQSTFENIVGRIYDLGLEDRFSWTVNPLVIEYKLTGQKIVFRGMNNPTSLNSVTFVHGFLTDIYIEEGFELQSFADFRKIDGSLRGKMPKGLIQQITICMNAWSKETWIYEEFFKGRLEDNFEFLDNPKVRYQDACFPDYIGKFGKGLYLHKSTYKINEFRDTEIYDASMEETKRVAPEIYKVEALGMWGNSTASSYPEFNDTCIVNIQDIIGTDKYGNPKYQFAEFAIGIDTGLSTGDGHVKKVKKGEDGSIIVKAATTMHLVAVTSDYKKMFAIDEYFHSNNPNTAMYNTDTKDSLLLPQLCDKIIHTLLDWVKKYGNSNTMLMKGRIKVYVDAADIGFRDSLKVKANEYGLYNFEFLPSTKISIQSRVDFEKLNFAYNDFQICNQCKNLIRELKDCRRGDKGEARKDGNDHAINSYEYGWANFRTDLVRWKTFKEH